MNAPTFADWALLFLQGCIARKSRWRACCDRADGRRRRSSRVAVDPSHRARNAAHRRGTHAAARVRRGGNGAGGRTRWHRTGVAQVACRIGSRRAGRCVVRAVAAVVAVALACRTDEFPARSRAVFRIERDARRAPVCAALRGVPRRGRTRRRPARGHASALAADLRRRARPTSRRRTVLARAPRHARRTRRIDDARLRHDARPQDTWAVLDLALAASGARRKARGPCRSAAGARRALRRRRAPAARALARRPARAHRRARAGRDAAAGRRALANLARHGTRRARGAGNRRRASRLRRIDARRVARIRDDCRRGARRARRHAALADRRGWLRARALPGSAGWSDADLLCRSDATARPAVPAATGDPLTALLLRVDTEPVRDVQAGLPH